MINEIVSMTKFGVHRAIPRSAAGNRQVSWDGAGLTNDRPTSLVKCIGTEQGSLFKEFVRKLMSPTTQTDLSAGNP